MASAVLTVHMGCPRRQETVNVNLRARGLPAATVISAAKVSPSTEIRPITYTSAPAYSAALSGVEGHGRLERYVEPDVNQVASAGMLRVGAGACHLSMNPIAPSRVPTRTIAASSNLVLKSFPYNFGRWTFPRRWIWNQDLQNLQNRDSSLE